METSLTRKISLDLIDDPRVAMRGNIQDEDIQQLMSDMREAGLIEPIVVRLVGERFEVIAGHRRTVAARLLGWLTIEAKIVDVGDDEAFRMRAIENLSRHDVNPVDEAAYVGELIRRAHKSPEEVAIIFNRSRVWIEQRMAIYDMPAYLKEYLGQRRLSLGVALELSGIGRETTRAHYSHWAALHGMSVAGAKRLRLMWEAEGLAMQESDAVAQSAASGSGDFRAHTICRACGTDAFLDDMENVWTHASLNCPASEAKE